MVVSNFFKEIHGVQPHFDSYIWSLATFWAAVSNQPHFEGYLW